MKSWGYAGIWALVLLAGCSGDKAGKRPVAQPEPIGNPRQAAEPIRPGRGENEKLKELDLNRDNQPDVWLYTVEAKRPDGQPVERRVRKEVDLNWDGRVDMTTVYNEREEKVREAIDQDFDEGVDVVLFYEKGVNVRTERDTNSDGRIDQWLFYEKGKLARKERDTNNDGRADNWEYWESGQVDRIGEDLDSDGNVDRWTKNPNSQ